MKLSLPAIALVLLPASAFAQDPLDGRTLKAVRVSGLTHISAQLNRVR